MITRIKTLGLRAQNGSAIRVAALRIRKYVEGPEPTNAPAASKALQPSLKITSPSQDPEIAALSVTLAAYYEGRRDGRSRGRAKGAGAASVGLVGDVPGEQLVSVLSGVHAVTGAPLLASKGSTGRVGGAPKGSRPVPMTGPPDEWLTITEAAFLASVDPSNLRRLAEHQPRVVFPTATPGDELDPRVVRRLAEVLTGAPITPPATQYLLASKGNDEQWRVQRREVERFIADRPVPETVIGYDLVCSAPKSVSLLWAVGDDKVRADIAASFDAAIDATISYLEQHATFGMVDGRNHPGEGLAIASYVHDTSRAVEAHLHTHNIIVNAVRVEVRDDTRAPMLLPDGSPRVEWRALDSGALISHVKAAGYVGAAELRHQLTSRWGVEWGTVRNGVAELADIPADLLAAFSSRTDQIAEEFASLVASGAEPDATTKELAQRGTRAPKRVLADEAVRALHVSRLKALGWTPEELCTVASVARQPRALGISDAEVLELFDQLVGRHGLTERQGTFTSREVHEAVAAWAADRLPARQVRAVAEAFLSDPRVVACSVTRTRRRQDPEAAFTTEDLLAVEDNLLTLFTQGRVDHGATPVGVVAKPLIEDAIRAVNQEIAQQSGDLTGGLSAEQAELVSDIVECGDAIRCVVGPAGTGKTEAMRAAVKAWQSAGVPVVGTANGGTQAEQLAERLSIETQVVAAWLTRLDTSSDPSRVWLPGTVVVVDEATQVSSRDAERLARWARRTGAVLVCIGDPAQLGSVGAGGWFRHLVYSHGAPSLSTIYRQQGDDLAQVRRALAGLRSEVPERVRRAMDRLVADGRVRVFDAPERMLTTTVDDWYADRQARLATPAGQRAPKPSRMMAAHLRDVDVLNRLARARLKADGTLGDVEVEVAGRCFAVGDEVITLTQAGHTLVPAGAPPTSFVRTGTVGTVTAVHRDHTVDVTFPGRGRVRVGSDYLTHEFSDGRVGGLTHAYAITADRSQGSTMHAARAVATDTTSRPALYVMLSRGEREIGAYVIRDREVDRGVDDESWLPVLHPHGGPLEAVVARLEQSRIERLATDLDPVAWQAHQLRRKNTLATLAALRAATRQDGGPTLLIVRRAELAEEAAVRSAAVERPHPVLVRRLGVRPPGGAEQRAWDGAVGAVACYQLRWRPTLDPDHTSGAAWAIGSRPGAEKSAWAVQRAEAEAVIARWAATLPPAQAKRFWAVIEHIPRERATAGVHALLAAGYSASQVLDALAARESGTARAGAPILDWRVREVCGRHSVDPTVFTLPPPLTAAEEWDHVHGLLETAESMHLSGRPTSQLANERRQLEQLLPSLDSHAQAAVRDRHHLLVKALDLQVDRAVAQLASRTAGYLVALLGSRPVSAVAAAEWDRRARVIESWRHHRLGVPYGRAAADANRPPSEQALGPERRDDLTATLQRRRLLDHAQATLDLGAGA